MPPSRLLTAQLLVNLATAAVVVVLIAGVGGLVLGIPLPGNPSGFLLSLVLGTPALSSVGLLVAALALRATWAGDAPELLHHGRGAGVPVGVTTAAATSWMSIVDLALRAAGALPRRRPARAVVRAVAGAQDPVECGKTGADPGRGARWTPWARPSRQPARRRRRDRARAGLESGLGSRA